MGRAEVGSTKHLANKMKSKGLQRLRWYCQVCEKQCRDENGFKCHVNSESHVRNMQVVGLDPKKVIREYSQQFKNDFMRLLRTAHGEKPIQINHFYQEYISEKEHIHMNATQWSSLTEFAKYLGKEGICRVTETDKGIQIAWIDDSPEAMRRRDAIAKRERQDKGDEEREQKLIEEQVRRAEREAAAKDKEDAEKAEKHTLEMKEGEAISFSFGKSKAVATAAGAQPESTPTAGGSSTTNAENDADPSKSTPSTTAAPAPVKMSFGMKPSAVAAKPKNVFAQKKNPLAAGSKAAANGPTKAMSNMERIMKEEMERKRQRPGENLNGGGKRMKLLS